jgi:hypothetical protein
MAPRTFEKAVFSDPRKADYRARWTLLLLVLLALAAVYWIARDILYQRLVFGFAQRLLNDLGSATVEDIESVSVDGQGDVTLRRAQAFTLHRGVRRPYFRAEEIRLTLDGIPLRDDRLRVMRVDLVHPEIFVRREADGEWNLEWALERAPRAPDRPVRPPSPDDRWKDFEHPDDAFPHGGVHIHDGIVHVTFVAPSGMEITWHVSSVRGTIERREGKIVLKPFTGNFYGGQILLFSEITTMHPLLIKHMKIDVRDADVSLMGAGVPYIKHPVTGRLNALFALTYDPDKMRQRPIASGHCEITDGDLWDLPAFSAIIHILALSPVSEKRLDTAILEFTVEDGHYRIDKMQFLGYPLSLFGEGVCSLTGDWMEIVFVPRLGKSDWNSILPVIGTPIQLLADVFKGAFLPVVLTGSFGDPQLTVEPLHFLKPSVKSLIEEKSPR